MGNLKCISRLMTLFGFGSRRLCFFFALVASSFFSTNTFAQDYYFYQSGNYIGGQWTSAASACDSISSKAASAIDYLIFDHYELGSGVNMGGYYTFSCDTYTSKVGDPTVFKYTSATINREGAACPSGSTLNASTNDCDAASKCIAKKGAAVGSYAWHSSTDTPAATISIDGCAATISGVSLCKNTTKKYYSCTGTATYTGEELAATDVGSECSGDSCNSNDPQPESKTTPCVMVAYATGGKSCSTTDMESNPGTTKCGTANDIWVCTESPKSTSKDSTANITQTTTTASDGSVTDKTTTVTTTQTCKGAGQCTTSTTTTTSTGGTSATGTDLGTTTECSGADCNAASDDSEDEEEEDDSSVSGDMACTAVVQCSGDVIQCAILRQEQQSRCSDEDFKDLSDTKVTAAKTAMQSEFSGTDYQAITADADHTFDISNMIDTSSFLGASCPVLPSISGSYGQFAFSVDFNLDAFCTFLTILGYINVAFAFKKAAEIVGNGVA